MRFIVQVNVKNSVDWPEHEYEDFCRRHSGSDQEYVHSVYSTLLSMCGIPRLLKQLQKRQLDHMLSQRHQLLSNLDTLSNQLKVQASVFCKCFAVCDHSLFPYVLHKLSCDVNSMQVHLLVRLVCLKA